MRSQLIEDYGLQLVEHPITSVRIVRVDGHWHVQYKRKAKWWLDGFWWFTEGVYAGSNYSGALDHAQQLINDGFYTKLEYKKDVFQVELKG